MKISQALDGFLLSKRVENLGPRTLELYERQLTQAARFLDDAELSAVTSIDLGRFLDYLKRDYTPRRLNGDTSLLAANTLCNYSLPDICGQVSDFLSRMARINVFRRFTISPFHYFAVSLFRRFAISPFHYFAVSLFRRFAISPFHYECFFIIRSNIRPFVSFVI